MIVKRSGRKLRLLTRVLPFVLIVIAGVAAPLVPARAILPNENTKAPPPQLSAPVVRLLKAAEEAQKNNDPNLALIHLKNAVRLAPQSGEVRARLGLELLRGGAALAAERELRQARDDKAPADMVVPGILQAMIQRNEIDDLLTEFPDPPRATRDPTAPDILRARAIALQVRGRNAEANAAMDRALALRRDGPGLITRAKLARQQDDDVLARTLADEAVKLEPTDEEALIVVISLMRKKGEIEKAFAAADDFGKRNPKSSVGKILRIEGLLDLKRDAEARREVDAFLKLSPKSMLAMYYRAVLLARANELKEAWEQAQALLPRFVQSEPRIAIMVGRIAALSGNLESSGAILETLISQNPTLKEARLELAAVRLRQQASDKALETLAPYVTSNDAAVHTLLAQAYLQQRRYSEAIASLENALASSGENDLLKRQLALSQVLVGNMNEAIAELRELVAREPSNIETAAAFISVLIQAGQLDEALAVVERVAKVATKTPLPAFFRGQVLIARGNPTAAAAAFGQALAVDPKFIPAYFYRATASIMRGNLDDANKDLRMIVARDPRNVRAYVRLAEVAVTSGRDSEAVNYLVRAVGAAPADPTPRLALINFLISRAQYREAMGAVNALLLVSPHNPEGLAQKGQIQMLSGAASDAVDTYRTLAAENNQSPSALILLAGALNAVRDILAAEDAAKKAVALAPASAQTRSFQIDIFVAHGKPADALTAARDYDTAYPGPDADLLLADTFIRLKRTNEAIALLTKSLAATPNRASVLRLSQLASGGGDTKKAGELLADWLATHPSDVDMRRQYASLLLTTKDQAGARREFELLLTQRPEDPVGLNNLGWALQKDDPERALALVAQAVKVAPLSPTIADTLGWMKYQQRDYAGAVPVLRRALELDAANPAIAYHLAVALDAAGNRTEAKTLLQAVLARNPKFDGVDEAKKIMARW